MITLEGLNIGLPGFDLKDINLSVRKNELFILMGPTGAGRVTFKSPITKSSVFKLELQEGSDVFLSFKSAAIHTF